MNITIMNIICFIIFIYGLIHISKKIYKLILALFFDIKDYFKMFRHAKSTKHFKEIKL